MKIINQEYEIGSYMYNVTAEITEEEYKKAIAASPYDLISDDIKMGYGAYGAEVSEKEGKYYLYYRRGDSCD